MILFAPAISLFLLCSAGASLGRQPTSQTKSVSLKRLSRASQNQQPHKFGSSSITNIGFFYLATTQVGGQTFDLLVDTGSSNTWVGAETKYIPGPSSHNTMRRVSFVYGAGNFSGTEFIDNVSVGDVTVHQQSIGAASSTFGIPEGIDGILGLGPADLTNGSVSGLGIIPTFMQNLVKQGVIRKNVLGIYFKPEIGNDTADVNGVLTFGGLNTTKCPGTIAYTPQTKVKPFASWWGVDFETPRFGSKVLSRGYSAIVDTGTPEMILPDPIFQTFLKVSGGVYDPDAGLVSFEKKPTQNFAFTISGVELVWTPDEYLVPPLQVPVLGLPPDQIWSWFTTSGPPPVFMGITAVLGMKFLESYCSIYDTDNNRIGFTKRG